jgi:hypothetical protein
MCVPIKQVPTAEFAVPFVTATYYGGRAWREGRVGVDL